jgi:hypothetical protein
MKYQQLVTVANAPAVSVVQKTIIPNATVNIPVGSGQIKKIEVDPAAKDAWLTYKNIKAGFQFLLPPEYKPASIPGLPSGGYAMHDVNVPTDYDTFALVSSSQNQHDYTLEYKAFKGNVDDFIKSFSPNDFQVKYLYPNPTIQRISFNGLEGIEMVSNLYSHSYEAAIFFVGNNHGFIISGGDGNLKLQEQIFSTFKFTQ